MQVQSGAGADSLIGGGLGDIVMQARGMIVLSVVLENDYLSGGIGSDFIEGGVGNDTISAATYYFGEYDGRNTIIGGAGDDTVVIPYRYG